MKCPIHSDRDVIGYCADCGAFGCDECITTGERGSSLCAACQEKKSAAAARGSHGLVSKLLGEKKKPKSGAGKSSFSRSSVVRKSRAGRKLEVHFKDGNIIRGSTYKLDLHSVGFHLVPIEPIDGKDRIHVIFSDLRAIHVVRDFDERSGSFEITQEIPAEGQEIKVAFRDGKIIEGHTLHRFDPTCQRFFIVPKDGAGKSISILVERSALHGIEMEGFREGLFAAEEGDETGEIDKKSAGRAPLSQNESMGDLYFSMKNYDSALSEYEKVRVEFPHDRRLGLKIAVCNFNRGVNFVKSRKYVEAKTEFEKIGEDDPIYEKAKKKIRKIDKILKDAEKIGG